MMALVRLRAHTTFDQTDGAGMLLDARHDRCYALDPCQTLMLAALLEASSEGEAVTQLAEEIDAEDAELSQALASFRLELEAQGLVLTSEGADPGIANDVPGEIKDAGPVAVSAASSPRPASPTPVWERPEELSWEFFLIGRVEAPGLPPVSFWRRVVAACSAIRILLIYRLFARGPWLLHVNRALGAIPATKLGHLDADLQQRLARREIVFCQLATRLVAPQGLCGHRSLALCAYLRVLGLPARFFMGRAHYSLNSYEFHAWTAVSGRAVNEMDELLPGYIVLQQLPQER